MWAASWYNKHEIKLREIVKTYDAAAFFARVWIGSVPHVGAKETKFLPRHCLKALCVHILKIFFVRNHINISNFKKIHEIDEML